MNIVLGRQLRAARVLAGLTQRQLSTEAGFNPRACRYWESRSDKLPTHTPVTKAIIEQVLRRHGVEVFSIPTPSTTDLNYVSGGGLSSECGACIDRRSR